MDWACPLQSFHTNRKSKKEKTGIHQSSASLLLQLGCYGNSSLRGGQAISFLGLTISTASSTAK